MQDLEKSVENFQESLNAVILETRLREDENVCLKTQIAQMQDEIMSLKRKREEDSERLTKEIQRRMIAEEKVELEEDFLENSKYDEPNSSELFVQMEETKTETTIRETVLNAEQNNLIEEKQKRNEDVKDLQHYAAICNDYNTSNIESLEELCTVMKNQKFAKMFIGTAEEFPNEWPNNGLNEFDMSQSRVAYSYRNWLVNNTSNIRDSLGFTSLLLNSATSSLDRTTARISQFQKTDENSLYFLLIISTPDNMPCNALKVIPSQCTAALPSEMYDIARSILVMAGDVLIFKGAAFHDYIGHGCHTISYHCKRFIDLNNNDVNKWLIKTLTSKVAGGISYPSGTRSTSNYIKQGSRNFNIRPLHSIANNLSGWKNGEVKFAYRPETDLVKFKENRSVDLLATGALVKASDLSKILRSDLTMKIGYPTGMGFIYALKMIGFTDDHAEFVLSNTGDTLEYRFDQELSEDDFKILSESKILKKNKKRRIK